MANACRAGWVAVLLRDGGQADAAVARSLADLVRQYPDAAAIGIDMPLGFVTMAGAGPTTGRQPGSARIAAG